MDEDDNTTINDDQPPFTTSPKFIRKAQRAPLYGNSNHETTSALLPIIAQPNTNSGRRSAESNDLSGGNSRNSSRPSSSSGKANSRAWEDELFGTVSTSPPLLSNTSTSSSSKSTKHDHLFGSPPSTAPSTYSSALTDLLRPIPPPIYPIKPHHIPKLSHHVRHHHVNVAKHSAAMNVPGDVDIVSSMAGRLSRLEEELVNAKVEIQSKDEMIHKLERELEVLKLQNNKSEQVSELENRCKKLDRKMEKMQAFLEQYELEDSDDDEEDGEDDEGDEEEVNTDDEQGVEPETEDEQLNFVFQDDFERIPSYRSFPFDIETLAARVTELNIMAGDGVSQIVANSDSIQTHTLRQPDAVPLAIYRNGILFKSGPFRAFTQDSARAFIQDIMDGYFPEELKDYYPDGVVFELRDHHEEYFPEDDTTDGVLDRQLRPTVSRSRQPSSSSAKKGKIKLRHVSNSDNSTKVKDLKSSKEITPATKESFLNKLPKYVIRDGQIVNVREGINELLGATPTSEATSRRTINLSTLPTPNNIPQNEITTLRIQTPDNATEFIVKLRVTDTIHDLMECLNIHVIEQYGKYTLRSPVPGAHFEDHLTMKDAGLTPTAKLYIKPLGK